VYFFLEVDRGTMPATRKDLWQTSFLRKLLGYAHTLREGIHTKHYGMRRVRVLTVTTSAGRVESFIEAYRQHVASLCPPSAVLFADHEALTRGDPLTARWFDGDGAAAPIIPTFVSSVSTRSTA
jgi:hypothetical protein